jgi:hypothetical protein
LRQVPAHHADLKCSRASQQGGNPDVVGPAIQELGFVTDSQCCFRSERSGRRGYDFELHPFIPLCGRILGQPWLRHRRLCHQAGIDTTRCLHLHVMFGRFVNSPCCPPRSAPLQEYLHPSIPLSSASPPSLPNDCLSPSLSPCMRHVSTLVHVRIRIAARQVCPSLSETRAAVHM